MSLKKLGTYRARRNFARTGEPAGELSTGPAGGDAGLRFAVHKHQATADHYDLRLELGGVLKCWAVPKGPSLDPAERRLAVETEDHPLAYAEFEGVIPEGEYGGGPMIVWDRGIWAPMGDPETDLAKGAFKFRLSGQKLTGGWMLARLRPKPGETRRNWLLIKERDAAAAPGSDILAARPESVKSGLRIEDLTSVPVASPDEGPRARRLRPGSLPGARRAAMPERVAPQLASTAAAPPAGKDWLHEIKLDGYRTMAHVAGGAARMITRSGLDWTGRYGDLPEALAALPCREAVVDGEIVRLDAAGVSRFADLQEALSQGGGGLVFFAFDLLHLDGWDIAAAPLVRRKAMLARLLAGAGQSTAVRFSDHVVGQGAAFFERASALGLEGVVSKRASAPYAPGRSRSWTKTKAQMTGDFVIAGYTSSAAAGGLGALALAEWQDGMLAYRGKVGTGFDARTLADLADRLAAIRDDGASTEGAPRDVIPVRPVLTARVRYANRTADGALRHAVFVGLREVAPSGGGVALRRRLISEADLAAVSITNPGRRMFGRSGATKLDVAVYYAAIGDAMLPHLVGRPVSLVRCPTGNPGDCFFQRHAFTGMPETIARIAPRPGEGDDRGYIAIEDAKAYLALAQFGVVEFHIWGARRRQLETPDRIVLDLDPGEGIVWRDVVEAAQHVRTAVEAQGLVAFAKTTGGRGIHVVAPIVPRPGWKAVHAATRALAERIAATAPETFTTTMGASNRRRRIFIDFHRNARGATAAAPYTLRARPHLPASAPLGWRDLETIDAPEDLNYSSLPALISAAGDPWADIDAAARELPG